MDLRYDGELPDEYHRTLAEQVRQEPVYEEPEALADEAPAQIEPAGNGWLLLGIFLLVTIGVLMLLVFASGGDTNSSML